MAFHSTITYNGLIRSITVHFLLVVMRVDGGTETSDGGDRVLMAKDTGAGNDDIGAGGSGDLDGLEVETPVDLDVKVGIPLAEVGNLGHAVGHEGLAPEAGLNGHDEDYVGLVGVGVDSRDGGARLQSDSSAHASTVDSIDQCRWVL
jgi:hypothetical protein